MKTIILASILFVISWGAQSQTLIAYYPLDTSGTDIGPNLLHATVTGTTAASNHLAIANKAMTFTTGDKLTVNDTANFNLGIRGEITMSAWFKIATQKTFASIAICGTAAWNTGFAFGVNWETDKLMFGIGSRSGATEAIGVHSLADVTDGSWHHGLVTVNTTENKMKMYLDGVNTKIAKYNAFGVTGGTLSNDSLHLDITGLNYVLVPSTLLVLGNSPWSQNFDGDLDEIVFYDGPVTDQQVQTIYADIPLAVRNDILSSKIAIYPNPSNGMIHIESENPIQKIDVISHTGQLVLSKKINEVSPNLRLDIPAGIYIIKVYEDDKVALRKMVMH